MPGFDLKKGWLGSVLASLRQYPAAVPGSLRGHLITEELARVTIAAIAIGGGAFSLLNALAIQAGAILPGPADGIGVLRPVEVELSTSASVHPQFRDRSATPPRTTARWFVPLHPERGGGGCAPRQQP